MEQPLVTVFTPVHSTSAPYLPETYKSLCDQTYTNWEWVLVPNNGGTVPLDIASSERVRIVPIADELDPYNSIGRLKRFACEHAAGDIYLELDADDLLVPTAIQKVVAAFADPLVSFVYSNDAEFEEGTWRSNAYSAYWGWRSRDFNWHGHTLKEMIAWEPSPHMMRYIFWAPDHVRAWRKNAYWQIGGHDPAIRAGDDHDVCCRTYIAFGAQGMKHINECLYLYRIHTTNSCHLYNDDVQKETLACYLKYSRDMAARWASDNRLRKLDLGGRFNAWPGFASVDLLDADIIADLNGRWPFEDSSVGVLRASHIFEHLKDPIHTMNEAFRVLAPGGWLFVDIPSAEGRGAFQDPTHVSFWNENSFWYYTNDTHAHFIRPQYTGRFQASRIITFYPTDFERAHNIPIVQADLIALKPPYSDRPVGEVLIQ